MNLMDKIVAVMVAGVLIGVGINQYMYDKDMDGVSNDKDDFPSDMLTVIWMESAIMKTWMMTMTGMMIQKMLTH